MPPTAPTVTGVRAWVHVLRMTEAALVAQPPAGTDRCCEQGSQKGLECPGLLPVDTWVLAVWGSEQRRAALPAVL